MDLGCFQEEIHNRAMPTLEGFDPLLDGHYRDRTDAVKKCALAASKRGYPVFALQHSGYCTSSSDGLSTYNKYGEADHCAGDGEGGSGALRVYKFITGKPN